MSRCTVFYEDWQMQCCGEPFKIGDTVKWLVIRNPNLTFTIDVGNIDYCYEAHEPDADILSEFVGTVTAIKHLYAQYSPSPDNAKCLVCTKEVLFDATNANGWEDDIDGMRISGYIVTVDNYRLSPYVRNV